MSELRESYEAALRVAEADRNAAEVKAHLLELDLADLRGRIIPNLRQIADDVKHGRLTPYETFVQLDRILRAVLDDKEDT